MCRWMAYSGGTVPLDTLIFNTANSLIEQSLESRLGQITTNGDGFGVGWYDRGETPGLYKSTQPAWNDDNLRDLCAHVDSSLFIAHVRASTGTPVQYTNCHPFRYGRWLFAHNGAIRDFPQMRRKLMMELDEEHFQELRGGTDSELMFMLALQFGLTDDPHQGMARMAGLIERIGREVGVECPLRMTLGVADGDRLYAVRYSSETESASLYYSQDLSTIETNLTSQQESILNRITSKARTIVSEPLSDLRGLWQPVPESSFLVIRDGEVAIEPFRPVLP